jgi:hypothetical protein
MLHFGDWTCQWGQLGLFVPYDGAMRTRLLLCCLLVVLTTPNQAAANPCAAARVDGRSLLTAGPQRGIRIAKEAIRIRIATDKDSGSEQVAALSKRFDIDYTFVNRGASREVVMGFPVVVPLVALGESKPPLKGFTVSGDGVGARVGPKQASFTRWTRRAVLHWCEGFALKQLRQQIRAGKRKTFRFDKGAIQLLPRDENGDVDGDREVIGWYFWRQRFRRGKTRLKVGYTMQAGGLCQTTYVLRTAKLWGRGVIGELSITLTVDNPKRLKGFSARLGQLPKRRLGLRGARRVKPARVEPRKGRMTWRFKRFSADRDFMIESKPCGEG